jgi:[CysO sulfur-carrier protein]-S-L-cysteine hydrolase
MEGAIRRQMLLNWDGMRLSARDASLEDAEGSRMNNAMIARASLDAIVAHAEREFPYECCGLIIGDGVVEEVRPIANIQNQKHAENPAAFSRDARTAFLMDPKEHLAVLNEIDLRKLKLRTVYHSHPDHDAYFSATDRAQACSFDPSEPDYPDTSYIVMSVRGGKFVRAAAFAWDEAAKEFAEVGLEVV